MLRSEVPEAARTAHSEAAPAAPRSLASVAERIRDLPHPARTRILLELAGDVEALSEELRRDGVSEAEAIARAEERVIPSGPALDALVGLHRPLYQRLTEPIPHSSLRRWEQGALLAATLGVLAGSVGFLVWAGLLVDPSPFLWGVLALSAATVALAFRKGFQLFVRREPRSETLERELGLILGVSGAALLAAGAGVVSGLWHLAAAMEAGAQDPAAHLMAWLRRDAVLLSVGLLTALTGGLAWFLLAQGAAAVRSGDQEVRRTLQAGPTLSGDGSPGTDLH